MPGGDGTGPGGPGRGGGRGAGAVGYCLRPKRSAKTPHRRGTPCATLTCPSCGARLTRGG